MQRLSPSDPRYQSAARIADAVLAGETTDPTAGATHFLNPTIVRQRRGGSLPAWAHGEGHPIGRHTFYSPDEGKAALRQAALLEWQTNSSADCLAVLGSCRLFTTKRRLAPERHGPAG